MIALLRTLAGSIVALGGLIAGFTALIRWGAFVGLCVLLVCEGIAAILMPNIHDDGG